MVRLKDNFTLTCKAVHKTNSTHLEFVLSSNKKIPSGSFLCFTCLGDFRHLSTANINYERVGSFFKVWPKKKFNNEWKFSFDNLKYEFRNFTDAPFGVFLDFGNGNYINIQTSFISDYIQQEINENIPRYKEVQDYLNTFPQVNKITSHGMHAEFIFGFHTENISAKRVDQLFANVLKTESMLNDKGVHVGLIRDNNINGYVLNIFEDKIIIISTNETFEFYAFVTLAQLWNFSNKVIDLMTIEDAPAFNWRGLTLDVVRQFYSIDEIKEILEHLALFKINILHLVLSNDEAWRLECDSYPVLHEIGAYRGYGLRIKPQFSTGFEKTGGYYKKEEIKELIKYAKYLQIDIMPEIDIPAHAHTILKCLPELVESEDKSIYISVQGYNDNTLNPAILFTWVFIENIIKEYSQIFDFNYFHMGFDERPYGSWENSPLCKKFMQKHHIKNTDALQTYCANKIIKLLTKYGKKAAFWEEAASDGNLDKDSLLFSWQTEEVAVEMANKGYEVIATPAQYCYFDIRDNNTFESPGLHWFDVITINKTYSFKIATHKNIKGIHGALFSETLNDKKRVYEMLFPRLIALSELAWTNDNRKNLHQFKNNLNKHLKNKFKKENT